MKPLILLSCLLLMAVSSVVHSQNSIIPVYSYHSDPPFQLPGQTKDLSQSWIDELNKYSEDITFELIRIERPKLNQIVESGQAYLILWANAAWFKRLDPKVKASDIIFWDADIWVSKAASPVFIREPIDLVGKKVGARKGFYYKGISPLMKKGEITRINNLNDKANYQALLDNKLDAYVMSRSSFMYWVAHGLKTDDLYVAQSPHDAFTRHLLYSQNYSHLKTKFNDFIKHIRTNREWQEKLVFWGVEKLVNPFELELDELINFQVQPE